VGYVDVGRNQNGSVCAYRENDDDDGADTMPMIMHLMTRMICMDGGDYDDNNDGNYADDGDSDVDNDVAPGEDDGKANDDDHD
jgi:hypothetical protein